MFKYIVIWVLTSYFSVPCFTPDPKPDEYGRMPTYRTMLAVDCLGSKVDTLMREFNNRDSALYFIKIGETKTTFFVSDQTIYDFKLDSIKIKK